MRRADPHHGRFYQKLFQSFQRMKQDPGGLTQRKELAGARVALFESRMAGPMSKSIRRHGGEVVSAPSVQEIPLEKNPEVFSFAERLFSGQIDVMIFMTGVGTRMLIKILSAKYPLEKIQKAFQSDRKSTRLNS